MAEARIRIEARREEYTIAHRYLPDIVRERVARHHTTHDCTHPAGAAGARAHGLAQLHNLYNHLPNSGLFILRPII
jgi:hypothetical protein